MAAARRLLAVAALVLLAGAARAYYLPGTYPQEFLIGDVIQAEVNSLVSSETEMPYDYYSMPFCKPPEGVHRSTSTINPGTILLGIRIENSPYNFTMMTKQQGLTVCSGDAYPDNAYTALTQKEVKRLTDRIKQQYRVRLILDNLPITTYDLELDPESVRPGFEVGYELNGKYYVNNHLMFKILVHETNGQYTLGKKASDAELQAAANIEAGGRRLLEGKTKKQPVTELAPGQKMFMIVR
jgi:transmembrane 9 superfamily protein 2/4